MQKDLDRERPVACRHIHVHGPRRRSLFDDEDARRERGLGAHLKIQGGVRGVSFELGRLTRALPSADLHVLAETLVAVHIHGENSHAQSPKNTEPNCLQLRPGHRVTHTRTHTQIGIRTTAEPVARVHDI